ncbi:BT_3987 domain-containing protein [Mariniflexile sp.]|uniref:BT_3987 domain-containing protein n=1 Tax=Mariniflexile sp. TaxID=1979402 RepID=UPI0035699869
MKKLLITLGFIGILFNSCEPYEDFVEDFDKTTVYFATQKPLRSIVSYDEMTFKVGVALAGKRENTKDEFADFVIDETLLTTIDGASVFTLLPESYYTLTNSSKMIIPAGKFIGDVTVTLNRELFTNDALSTANTYALPLRITNSSLDSIGGFDSDGTVLDIPKDYTILVVKYISEFSGTYYHKGTQNEVDGAGVVVNQTIYNNSDLSKNQTWSLTTVDRNSIRTSGIGANTSHNFVINVNESDNTISIDSPSSGVTNLVGSGSVNSDRSITLNYSYTLGGKNYEVEDTLVLRQAPEYDLGFEEW